MRRPVHLAFTRSTPMPHLLLAFLLESPLVPLSPVSRFLLMPWFPPSPERLVLLPCRTFLAMGSQFPKARLSHLHPKSTRGLRPRRR